MPRTSTPRRITDDTLRNIIIKRLPKLLEKEPSLRDYLASILAQKFADKRETEETIKEILQTIREQNRRLEEHCKRLEEHSKRLEEHTKILEELMKEIKSLRKDYNKTLGALGTRWGLYSERSFRDGIKAILETDFGLKVERYHAIDTEGKVFGKPDQVELDLIIHDTKVIVVGIKSSASKADLSVFWRKVKFFEEKEKKKVDRMVLISPMVDPRALDFAKETGIEVYTWPDEVEIRE